jgi:hypothetical protein
MTGTETSERRDWVSGRASYAVAWGLPSAALVAAIWAEPGLRTIAWAAALVWMGTACLANARRCGRVHCHFTGPFFLVMALVVVLHGLGVVALGPRGWTWIGVTIALGTAAIWILTEQVWGRYRDRRDLQRR